MKKIKLIDIKNELNDRIDVFICSSSFDKQRCFAIPEQVAQLNIQDKLIFFIKDLNPEICQNAEDLKNLLGSDAVGIDIEISDTMSKLKRMSTSLDKVIDKSKQQNFLVDITTFTHEGLLILFKLLQLKLNKKNNDKLFLCYNGAESYSYNEENPEDKWLSKGIKSIRSILGYPGLFDPSKKNHLVVLFGFEDERTKRLIDIFEYETVSLAFGSKNESIASDHQKLNESRHNELLRVYPNANKFEISLIDAYKTKDQILSYLESSDDNIVIAPMNNKISTIGAGLAAMEKPEYQLCYVTSNQYNFEAYSMPSDECYLFEITFDASSRYCPVPEEISAK